MRLRVKRKGGSEFSATCGCIILILLFNIIVGTFAFDYAFNSITGRHAPLPANMVCGLIGGEVTVPVAAVCWVLRLSGVPAPFIRT